CPVKTFLSGTINYPLTAPADFLQQLVVFKVCRFWEVTRFQNLILFVQERSETSLEKTEAAKSLGRVREDLAPASAADANYICWTVHKRVIPSKNATPTRSDGSRGRPLRRLPRDSSTPLRYAQN